MYSLASNQRISITPKNYAVQPSDDRIARLARLTGNWDGKDVGIVFVEELDVERDGERWWQFDLLTGVAEPVTLGPGEVQDVVAIGGALQTSTAFELTRSGAAGLRDPRRRVPYGLEPGQAFITWRRDSRRLPVVQVTMTGGSPLVHSGGNPRTVDNVTIYIDRWLAESDPANDDLDVARDAWFAHDFTRAAAIVEKAIPHSYELFLACIKYEFDVLQKRTRLLNPETPTHRGLGARWSAMLR